MTLLAQLYYARTPASVGGATCRPEGAMLDEDKRQKDTNLFRRPCSTFTTHVCVMKDMATPCLSGTHRSNPHCAVWPAGRSVPLTPPKYPRIQQFKNTFAF